eukprot:scaffold24422_cov112-Isochrysis_galbana.AAC.9
MSISSCASDHSAASQPHSQAFAGSIPSRQSGMLQPVVEEMLATVHAAGSSLFGFFSSCPTFDSTASHAHTPLGCPLLPLGALPCLAKLVVASTAAIFAKV